MYALQFIFYSQPARLQLISKNLGVLIIIRVNSTTNVFLYVQDFDKHALEKFVRACVYPTTLDTNATNKYLLILKECCYQSNIQIFT
jgi:hypothetical protein